MSLSAIQQSFYSRSFDFASVSLWLSGVILLALAIVAYLTVKAVLARRVRYRPHGSITDEKAIRKILQQAFEQRRPFEVQIQTEAGRRRPTLRCAPESFGLNSLTVEINGLKSLSDRWLGRQIMVFFRISQDKKYIYYTFASRIDGIQTPRKDVCQITLPMPARLENRQKRSFLRIAPPHEFIMGAALWCGENMPPPERLNELSAWPRPSLLHIPDRTRQFDLLDLSAGGARIGVTSRVMRAYHLQFNAVEQIILLLDLFDPEQGRRMRFWLLCRIQNIWREHASRDIQMGVQFLAWARPKESAEFGQQAGGIEWLRLSSSNEVEPVGNWIMRRHLELFRESPVDLE